MRPHFDGLSPVVHPLVLADRLEQRFEPDRSRTVTLPWFERDSDAPVFLLGADDFGRDVLSRLLHGARTSIGSRSVRHARRGADRRARRRVGRLPRRLGRRRDHARRRFVLVLPVIYVVLVLRAVLPLVLPASTVFLLVVVDLRAGRLAVRRAGRARDRRGRARSRVRAGGAIARRRPASDSRRAPDAGVRRPLARPGHAAAAGVHPRRSDAVVRRPRLSRPVASWGTMLAGAGTTTRCAISMDAGARGRDLPVVLGTNLLVCDRSMRRDKIRRMHNSPASTRRS